MTLFVITGPPAAGKSTWIREHAQPGDITIDLDTLTKALTPTKPNAPQTDVNALPTPVKEAIFAARKAAITAAVGFRQATNIYIIDATPTPQNLQRYRMMDARIITIDPGRDVVLKRCEQQRSPRLRDFAARYYA